MIDSLLRQLLLLIQPVGIVWLSLAVLAAVLWRRRQRGPAVVAGALFVFVSVIGGTDFSGWLLRRLEQPWAGVKISGLLASDAVLVLGGGLEPSQYEAGGLHLTKAGDRLVMGLELMRLGKAPALVIGGGTAKIEGRELVEADVAKSWLESRKLPLNEVVSLGAATDTRDEAVRFAALAKQRGWRRVLLVTSASHMRRAAAVYRALGIDPVPVSCNFASSLGRDPGRGSIGIPTWAGFEKFDVWMHETAGWAIYRVRGWVRSGSAP